MRQWKLGGAAFLIVLTLSAIAIAQRQERYNVVFSFSVPAIARRIDLPSARAIRSTSIVPRLHLLLGARAISASITHAGGRFTIEVDAVAADAVDRVQAELSAVSRELAEQLSAGVDLAPLSARLAALEARLDLLAAALGSTALSAYQRYQLEDRALELRERRAAIRDDLDALTPGVLGAETTERFRARQMTDGVLFVLAVVLSGFVATAAMLLGDALRGTDARGSTEAVAARRPDRVMGGR